MSLRGFFSRNTETHRRRKNALTSAGLATRAEYLEDRVLLSVDSPTLVNHGISFNNTNVLSSDIFFYAVNNPRFSNNPQGSGLHVDLDGNGSPPAVPAVPQLNSINYSPNFGPLMFSNNGNTGSTLRLRDMTVDTLVIDASNFNANGRSGLIIDLTNVTVNTIVISNSLFLNNVNDGLCLLGNNVSASNIFILNSHFSANSRTTTTSQNTGALLQFQNSRLGQVSIVGNTFTDNGGHGLHLDFDNTSVANLEIRDNHANVNARNGNFAGMYLDFQDSDVSGTITNNNFGGNRFQPVPANPNLTQGEGLLVRTRRSILPNGTVAGGLRNLQLDSVRGNAFTTNGGAGALFDIGQNTTLRSTIAANNFQLNGRTGLTIQGKDTQDSFDVQIGGTSTDAQSNPVDANTITQNRGAGVVIDLDDTSNVLGNTTGRFRLLNNVISNNVNDNLLNTQFTGEGLFVRARGAVALNNGASRLLNSRVDGNLIENNASHGMMFDISEDSEVIDLLIGDVENPADPNEGFEGDGFTFENRFIRNSGNTVRNNAGDGLNFLRRDNALAQNVQVLDNLFEANANGVNYTVRNLNNVVNTLQFAYNDVVNNRLDGLNIETQIDAILVADLDRNLISGNLGDGIFTDGFEGDGSDAETLGGVWTRNTVQGNQGIGISLNGVPGGVSTLQIGLLGTDSLGNSLGNLIDSNGDDGVEINAPGEVNFENNVITFNGQNNINPVTGLPDVHGDGKGIDINLNDVGLPFNVSGAMEVYLGFNIIQGNFGDGLEIISRDNNFTATAVQLLAYGNIIDLNAGRGVDILNAGDTAETYVVFGDGSTGDGSNRNIIRSNGLEGFYAVNTTSTTQSQSVDATAPLAADGSVFFAPNLTLDLNGNEIQANGLPTNPGQLNGSGLVIRVGTSGTSQFGYDTIPDRDANLGFSFPDDYVGVGTSNSAEFGNGRVNARVNNNTFGGNRGVDVITESFASTVDPVATAGAWTATAYNVTAHQTDPLARFNFEFTNNTGNSVELIRLGAFYDNAEGTFKSRLGNAAPPGPFNTASAGRFRNAQRLPDRPSSSDSPTTGSGGLFSPMSNTGEILSIFPGSPNVPIRVTTAPREGFVFDASNATPIVITSFNHQLVTGELVQISGVQGNTAANGIFQVTVLTPDTFSLQDPFTGMDIAGNGDYLGGGQWTALSGHGLFDGDVVSISAFGFGDSTPGFDIEGLYEVTVINETEFFLNNTEGETHVPTSLFFGEFREVTLPDPFLYPGLGGSTFRIIESNNFFPEGTDFDEDVAEFSISYNTPASGELSYTYDREEAGTFNFRQISASNGTALEGDQVGFLITLSEPMSTDLFVDYQTIFSGSASDGTTVSAPPDADYVSTFDTAFIPAGATEVMVFIDTNADTAFEGDETFQLDLVSAYTFIFDVESGFEELQFFATPVDAVAVGTIVNDDSVPTVSISDAGGFEKGNGETGTMEFTVTLSNPSSTPVFVDYTTEDFTANAGVDYRRRTGTLTFAPGETVKTIQVEILPDNASLIPGSDVDQETLFINLTSVQGAIPADTQGLGTIFEPRFVTISNTFVDGEGNGTSQAIFTVRLTDANGNPTFVPQDQTITVDFFTSNGTATAGSDYVPVDSRNPITPPQPLELMEFESQKSIVVTVNQDLLYEGDETFFVTISSPEGTVRPGQATGTATILESAEVASTRDANGQGVIQVFNYRTNTPRFQLAPFPGFQGDIRVATADFNQDGIQDIVAAAGPGGGPHVKVLNGGDGSLLFDFFAYDPIMTSGVFVATGDVDADGNIDIITGPDFGGGPNVRVFEYNPAILTVEQTEDSLADGLGVGFTGGLRVAAADVVLSDPGDEIIIGYGPGSLPRVEVFLADGNILTLIDDVFSFNAYAANFTGGVFVSAADIGTNASITAPDGIADIITGAGAGGGPHVQIFSGSDLSVLESFFAYGAVFSGGVRVASGDVNDAVPGSPARNRVSEIITAPGATGGPHVRAFSVDGSPFTTPVGLGPGVFPFSPNLTSGVFIAGRTRGNPGEGSPLRLDPSVQPSGDVIPTLTEANLQPVVEAAFARLQSAGLSEAGLNELRNLEFVITDLEDNLIGLQTPGRIWLDRTAAGLGYFVDLTPHRDEEFTLQDGRLIANSIAAQGKIDLLSVLLHELGHALGEDHETDPGASHELLAPTILPGERRLPEVDLVFSANELFESLMDLN